MARPRSSPASTASRATRTTRSTGSLSTAGRCVRRPQGRLLALFAGACGHRYGCHDIWQFYAPAAPPSASARTPWTEGSACPARRRCGTLAACFESLNPTLRIPDPSLVVVASSRCTGTNPMAASIRVPGAKVSMPAMRLRISSTPERHRLGAYQISAWPRCGCWTPVTNHGLLLTILLHCHDDQGRPLHVGPPRSARPGIFCVAYADIPAAVEAMRNTGCRSATLASADHRRRGSSYRLPAILVSLPQWWRTFTPIHFIDAKWECVRAAGAELTWTRSALRTATISWRNLKMP